MINLGMNFIRQALQYDMDIECHIEAYPPPAIIWIKDDIILSNNQHYSISHFATADEFTDSTLRVITIEKRQYGDYKCKAVNKLGGDEAKAHLFETVIPVRPNSTQANYPKTYPQLPHLRFAHQLVDKRIILQVVSHSMQQASLPHRSSS
jgi:hypothetical protein